MKYYITSLFVCVIFSAQAQKVYNYSAADKAILKSADKKYLRLSEMSHKEAYPLGKIYERIYDTYKDTSMQRAVICYESFCASEGVDYYTVQQKSVAFKLGQVYEKGKGIARDTVMSMAWYQISTPEGVKRSIYLQKIFCNKDLSFSMFTTPVSDSNLIESILQKGGSLFINFLPQCIYSGSQVAPVALPISKVMRDNPKLKLEISFSISNRWNYTFNLGIQNDSRKTIDKLINYVIEREGISAERIVHRDLSPDPLVTDNKKGMSIIEFSLQNEDSLFYNDEAVTFEGKFRHKENSHCSSNIWFNKNGAYYFEAGCEDRSSISFGTYRATKDEIRLTPSPKPELSFTMTFKDTVGGSWMRMVDQSGKPINTFELLTIAKQNIDTLLESQRHYPDSVGRYAIHPEDGLAFTFKRYIRDIDVSPVFKKWYPLDNMNNKMVTIKFNYPVFTLSYPYITEGGGYPTRYWINSGPGSYTTRLSFVDSDGRTFTK